MTGSGENFEIRENVKKVDDAWLLSIIKTMCFKWEIYEIVY